MTHSTKETRPQKEQGGGQKLKKGNLSNTGEVSMN